MASADGVAADGRRALHRGPPWPDATRVVSNETLAEHGVACPSADASTMGGRATMGGLPQPPRCVPRRPARPVPKLTSLASAQVPYKLCPYGGPYGGSLPFCKPTDLRGFGTFCQGSRGLKWFLASPGFCGTTKVRRRARRPRQRGRA